MLPTRPDPARIIAQNAGANENSKRSSQRFFMAYSTLAKSGCPKPNEMGGVRFYLA